MTWARGPAGITNMKAAFLLPTDFQSQGPRKKNVIFDTNIDKLARGLFLRANIQPFMPYVGRYTSSLSGICSGGRGFEQRPIHQIFFEQIQAIACRRAVASTNFLVPIDPSIDVPIWRVTNTSLSGIGAYYGQSENHETMRPVGFMSRKFTDVQHSYTMHDQEMLAITELLLKWREKFIGRRVNIVTDIVTDHEANEWFKIRPLMSGQHICWQQFLI